jgi:hypothetical protein
MYNAGDSLTTVACSDGANGIMTKFGYSNLSPMYPYVTAFSGATWNSPNCGKCVRVQGSVATVYLTVIDQCGPPPGGHDAHFDIAPTAFRELFGDAGVNAGVQIANWAFVDSSMCKGNKGNGGTPSNPPPPPPSGGTTSNIRCGYSWVDANGKCGIPCRDNGPCQSSGQSCFADLSPCNRAISDDVFSEDSFVADAALEDNFEADAAVADVALEDNFEVDAAVADVALEDNFEADAAVADVALEDNFEVDTTVTDAGLEDNVVGDQQFYDAAVGDAATVNTAQTQSTSEPVQGWAIALMVLFSVIIVLLLAVLVIVAKLRNQM